MLTHLLALALFAQPEPSPQPSPLLPELVIDRDNVVITESCRIRIPEGLFIPDPDNNGVIHVAADNITIEWPTNKPGSQMLARDGASDGTDPHETFTGIGIRIDGHHHVTIRGAHIHRYKHAIWATNAYKLVLEDCDVSDGYAMRLGSTPAAEDSSDWLWPHDNDNNQWATNYGAGIWIEDSSNVTVSGCVARRTQNALILENVTDSRIYDNDFSFLSGWGIAMWRSSRNVISRNALDFCIRGYSHAVYNRGQDSAGILLFEQCNQNLFIENSATHGGDGVFGFGGKEAMGDTPAPATDSEGNPWTYERKGCNDNLFIGNDFSYAAAHGLELTFSFGNVIAGNLFNQNAICGIWGGYSQDTLIASNQFARNGEAGYGLERGGINIEHSERNTIANNTFTSNAAGVHLWHDADPGLMSGKWAAANHQRTRDNLLVANRFTGDAVGIHLRAVESTRTWDNQFTDVATPVKTEASPGGVSSEPIALDVPPTDPPGRTAPMDRRGEALGARATVGARPALAGRHNIIMGEYFPWNHQSPMVRRAPDDDGKHIYEILGVPDHTLVQATVNHGSVRVVAPSPDTPTPGSTQPTVQQVPHLPSPIRAIVSPNANSDVTAYTLTLAGPAHGAFKGVLIRAQWMIDVFDSAVDPREDLEAWRARRIGFGTSRNSGSNLVLRYAHGGIDTIHTLDAVFINHASPPPMTPSPGSNYFGTIANTTLRLPPGRWRISTLSDDGVRVIVNDHTILENWTHHGPTRDSADFDIPLKLNPDRSTATPLPTRITVEHFELDGYAVLELQIEPVPN